ncbi:MAG: helix-turn-helix domain-containing protein [Alphaproteobacteria bacterium]|nr:helix-turn-helix domain-containing protein [Alphaproteobacteria bacterium]
MAKHLDDKLTLEFKKNLTEILAQRKGKTNAKKLSLDSGLGETAIRDILQGRSGSPRLETIHKIAKGLKVPVYRLIPSMVDQSWEQVNDLEEENKLLREIAGSDYETLDELRELVKKRTK